MSAAYASLPQGDFERWHELTAAVALRFNREFQGQAFQVPDEVAAMPIYQDYVAGTLQNRLASPFWELARPRKKQHCLDLGCGVGFLLYPWRDWEALFYGHDISKVACDILNTRAPQLNSKLFKGTVLGAAHDLSMYEPGQFDLVIATGISCYYPIAYWQEVLTAVQRVLKPGSYFVFDVVNAEATIAENWAILETYFGAEVFLEPEADWRSLLKTAGARITSSQPGDLFTLYKVRWG